MMDQQKKTTTLSDKSNKRARGKLDDLITRLNPDTIQTLISVLKEHSVDEIIDSLNKSLENPPKKRPKLESSLAKISSRLSELERKVNVSAVDEKTTILNDGQAVSKSIFEAVSKHIQTTQPRFDLDAVIPRGTRLMLVVLRGDRHESSTLFLCSTQKKLEDLFKHFQIRDEVTPEMIHVLTAVPCEPVDWICFIDLPGEIIMLDNFSVLSSTASRKEAQIQHPYVLSPNQQSTTCASLGNSPAPVVKSHLKKVRLQVIHENGTQQNLTVLKPVGSTMNFRDVLKGHAIPCTPEMSLKWYKPPELDLDYLIFVGSDSFIESQTRTKV